MQTWHSEIKIPDLPDICDSIFDETSVFFDIETTGFSSHHAVSYLIGCAVRQGSMLHIYQFFAEELIDEKDAVDAFINFIRPYKHLISFNGNGFDIPFLTDRCKMLHIDIDFSKFKHTDIFKSISPLKHFLKLDNCKQKTLEAFLGINREDKFSGGELINIYFDYLKTQDTKALILLRQHNLDDLIGMVKLLPILAYPAFFDGNYRVASFEKNVLNEFPGDMRQEMNITLTYDFTFPKRISFGADNIYFSAAQNTARFCIEIYSGELKFFYKNYKDYFYLPDEDIAIHKSVAFYVDKDFRTKAKAATCYSKKTGCFLPQFDDVIMPYFKLEYHDKKSFFECTSDFYQSDDDTHKYCSHLLQHLLEKSKKHEKSLKKAPFTRSIL